MVTNEPTVFVIDDDAGARESLAVMVRSKGIPVETFVSAERFLEEFDPSRPGCLVLDYRLPGMNGLELQKNLALRYCHLPVIILTGYSNVPLAVKAMEAGAYTLLEKSSASQEIWIKIKMALAANQSRWQYEEERTVIQARLATLTSGERWVLDLTIAGRSNKQIAAEMLIGLRTVELRRARIVEKMQARSIAELVRMVTLVANSQLPGR